MRKEALPCEGTADAPADATVRRPACRWGASDAYVVTEEVSG